MSRQDRKRSAPEADSVSRKAKKSKTSALDVQSESAPDFIPLLDDTARKTSKFSRSQDERERSRKKKAKDGKELSNGEKRKAARREDRKRNKSEKDRRKSNNDAEGALEHENEDAAEQKEDVAAEKRHKKRKNAADNDQVDDHPAPKSSGKSKRKHQDHNGDALSQEEPINPNRVAVNAKHWIAGEVHGTDPVPDAAISAAKKDKLQRFIAFIGNLPYSANADSITKHFSAIAPFHVRAPTDPSTKKSKGYAFLEFEGYDKMRSCLKLYHHSNFGEGKTARKINVELTAGGGGKGENRTAKIKEKNERLKEERKKAHEDESKTRKDGKGSGVSQVDGGEDEADENADIHPSRRKRMGI